MTTSAGPACGIALSAGRHRGLVPRPADQPRPRLVLRHLQQGLRCLHERLHADRRPAPALSVIVLLLYVGLLGLTGVRLHHFADRLHSRAGPGLPARQRRCCPTPPRCSGRADAMDKLEEIALKTPGVKHDDVHRRLLGVLPVRLVQLGHDLHHPRRIRRSARRPKPRRRPSSTSSTVSIYVKVSELPGRRCSARRRCRVWGSPAASSCRSRTAPAWACRPCRKRPTPSSRRPTPSPAWPASSPRSAPTRRSSTSTSTARSAKQMGVTLTTSFNTLNANMGSVYINQFNEFGRIWQVNIQAEGGFRKNADEPQAARGAQSAGAASAARPR